MTLPLVLLTHTLPEDWLVSLKGHVRAVTGPIDATRLTPELEAHLSEAEGPALSLPKGCSAC